MLTTQTGKLLYISDNAAEYLGHSMVSLFSLATVVSLKCIYFTYSNVAEIIVNFSAYFRSLVFRSYSKYVTANLCLNICIVSTKNANVIHAEKSLKIFSLETFSQEHVFLILR